VDPRRALSVPVVQRWAAGINAVGGDLFCERALIHSSTRSCKHDESNGRHKDRMPVFLTIVRRGTIGSRGGMLVASLGKSRWRRKKKKKSSTQEKIEGQRTKVGRILQAPL
jgi:hypothetical protein